MLHRSRPYLVLSALAGVLALSSCSSVSSVGSSVAGLGQKVTSGISSLTGPDITIVEARPESFKKAETGRDKALAFQRAQERQRQASVQRRRAQRDADVSPAPRLDDPVYLDLDDLPPLEDFEFESLLPEKPEI